MPDDVPRLARLDRVSVEDVWSSEPRQFTPWLASEENLRLLGETIDMDLQVESQEHPVGPFSADIVCREVATNAPVLIENQLGRTDHTHLGQILTYAASLKAETIIWIANPFTEEHRAALEWLNEVTNGEISFFGIEIELWRIEGSPIAPRFNVVAKPWTKRIPPDPVLTDSRRLQLEFWSVKFR